MSLYPLDPVILTRDLPVQGLRRADLGTIVDLHGPDAVVVEFVTASGRTQALVTLAPDDLRGATDDDLVTIRRVATLGS